MRYRRKSEEVEVEQFRIPKKQCDRDMLPFYIFRRTWHASWWTKSYSQYVRLRDLDCIVSNGPATHDPYRRVIPIGVLFREYEPVDQQGEQQG